MSNKKYWANMGCLVFWFFLLILISGCGETVTSEGEPASTVSITQYIRGSDIIANSDTIYLEFRPLTNTNEVIIKKNNVRVTWEVDYIIPTVDAIGTVYPACQLAYINDAADRSDGLKTGTIKYLGALSASDTIEVKYKYRKWTMDRYYAPGSSGTMTYSILGVTDIVPGGEEICIWSKSLPNPELHRLTRVVTVGATYGDYSINYTNPPSITFKTDPILIDGMFLYYIDDINIDVRYRYY